MGFCRFRLLALSAPHFLLGSAPGSPLLRFDPELAGLLRIDMSCDILQLFLSQLPPARESLRDVLVSKGAELIGHAADERDRLKLAFEEVRGAICPISSDCVRNLGRPTLHRFR